VALLLMVLPVLDAPDVGVTVWIARHFFTSGSVMGTP